MNITFVCIAIWRWRELLTCVKDSCVLLVETQELFCSSVEFQTCVEGNKWTLSSQSAGQLLTCVSGPKPLFFSCFVLCGFISIFFQAGSAIFSRSRIKIFSRKREKRPQAAAIEEGTIPQLQEINRKSNFTAHAALSWLIFRAQVRSSPAGSGCEQRVPQSCSFAFLISPEAASRH